METKNGGLENDFPFQLGDFRFLLPPSCGETRGLFAWVKRSSQPDIQNLLSRMTEYIETIHKNNINAS